MRKSAGALLAAALCLGAATAQSNTNVRIYLDPAASDSDVVAVRDFVRGAGGSIHDYVAGDVLYARVDTGVLSALQGFRNVRRVDPLVARAGRLAPEGPRPDAEFGFGVRLPKTAGEAERARLEFEKADRRVTKVSSLAPSPLARRRALVAGTSSLVRLADNSLSPHFPPIGDQEGRQSCVAWAICYYWSSYTHAMDEGVDIAGDWLKRDPDCYITAQDEVTKAQFMRCAGKPDCPVTSFDPAKGYHVWDGAKFEACKPPVMEPPQPSRGQEYIASPAFLYPLLNNGTDHGVLTAYMPEAVARLNDIGCGSWSLRPYEPWNYTDAVVTWPTEPQWIEALRRRTQSTAVGGGLGVQQFELNRAGQLDLLKQHLANGGIAITAGTVHDNWMKYGGNPGGCKAAGTCPGIDNDVLSGSGGTKSAGGHAVAIVGYDDDKTYVDDNGVTRQGAFLIANSAGPWFGTYNSTGSTASPGPDPNKRGFIWMGYDYAASSDFWRVWTLTDRPHYRPRLYAASRVAKANRADLGIEASVGLVMQEKFVSHELLPAQFWDRANALDPTHRVVVDLTDGLGVLDRSRPVPPLALTLVLVGSDTATIQATEFFLDATGNGNAISYLAIDPAKQVAAGTAGGACTNIPQNGDVNGSGVVNTADVTLIVNSLQQPARCLSDPRDMDRSGTISIQDARLAVTRCTTRGCR